MITYPLNKIEYQATDAELFHCTRNSGIYAGDDFVCTVTGADNNVTIGAGIGWIRNSKFSGKVIANKSDVVLDLGLADASLNRWDIVAIQFDKNNNATDFVVKHGTTASTPVRPEIVQTETLYELYLAAFYRKAGATTITASDVFDLRLDPTVCGLMADSVTEIDTAGINAQINALIEKLREEIAGIESSTEIMLKSVYDTDGDGVVDDAEKLNGQPASYYATKTEVQTAQTTADTAVEAAATAQTTANNAMPKSGGTMTGALTLHGDPTANLHAATKQYVDNKTGMDLLWTNAKTTSSFGAQTVSLNLSEYKSVKIEFRYFTGESDHMMSEILVDSLLYEITIWRFGSRSRRGVTVKKTGITFTNGGASDVAGTAPGSSDGSRCIPCKIYGVK